MQTCITSVNAHGLDLLHRLAASPESASGRHLLPNVSLELWQSLSHDGILRLARLPVLLFDLKFRDESWWQEATNAKQAAQGVAEPEMPTKGLVELSREVLMVAWLIAAADERAAALVSGMSARTAALVAGLTPPDVTRIASYGAVNLRPRWASSSSFWATLLSAASTPEDHMLRLARLHSLQLSCDVGARYVVEVHNGSRGDA